MRAKIHLRFAALCLVGTLLLAACSDKHHAWVDEETAAAWGEEVVSLLAEREFEALSERYLYEHTAEELRAEFTPHLDAVGKPMAILAPRLASGSANGQEYLTVYQPVQFEDTRATYTITFFKDGTIGALSVG